MRKRKPVHERLKQMLRRIFRKPEADPDDPYALVGAPKKPRPPLKTSAAHAEIEQ